MRNQSASGLAEIPASADKQRTRDGRQSPASLPISTRSDEEKMIETSCIDALLSRTRSVRGRPNLDRPVLRENIEVCPQAQQSLSTSAVWSSVYDVSFRECVPGVGSDTAFTQFELLDAPDRALG